MLRGETQVYSEAAIVFRVHLSNAKMHIWRSHIRTKKPPWAEGKDLYIGLFHLKFMYVSEQKQTKN